MRVPPFGAFEMELPWKFAEAALAWNRASVDPDIPLFKAIGTTSRMMLRAATHVAHENPITVLAATETEAQTIQIHIAVYAEIIRKYNGYPDTRLLPFIGVLHDEMGLIVSPDEWNTPDPLFIDHRSKSLQLPNEPPYSDIHTLQQTGQDSIGLWLALDYYGELVMKTTLDGARLIAENFDTIQVKFA